MPDAAATLQLCRAAGTTCHAKIWVPPWQYDGAKLRVCTHMCSGTSSTNGQPPGPTPSLKISHSSTALVQQGFQPSSQESNTLHHLPPTHTYILPASVLVQLPPAGLMQALTRPHQLPASVACWRDCLYELLQARQMQMPYTPHVQQHTNLRQQCVPEGGHEGVPCGPPAARLDTKATPVATFPSPAVSRKQATSASRAGPLPPAAAGLTLQSALPHVLDKTTATPEPVGKHPIPVVELFGEPAAHHSVVQTKPG